MASCDSSETEHQGEDARATDGEELDRLLDEQRAYYRALAADYLDQGLEFPGGDEVTQALDAFQGVAVLRRTVNLAARIAEYAGEVLVSEEVVDAVEGGPVSFVEIGPVELKGVPGTLRLYTVRRNA